MGQTIHQENNRDEKGEDFGDSVNMDDSGYIIAVSAKEHAEGAVRTYKYNQESEQWEKFAPDLKGDKFDDEFGQSISLSGNGKTLAIGIKHNGKIAYKAGQVQVFKHNGDKWMLLGSKLYGKYRYGRFGYALAISQDGKTVAVGSHTSSSGSDPGYAEVYRLVNDDWVQMGQMVHYGIAENSSFGNYMAISSNGKVMAICSDDYNGDRGIVRMFEWDGNVWTHIGKGIEGPESGSHFARVVSLSGDGKRMVIGAPYHNEEDSDDGWVGVYDLTQYVSLKSTNHDQPALGDSRLESGRMEIYNGSEWRVI